MPEVAAPPAVAPEIDELARFLVDRGLAVPAMFFLAMHRPLAHLSSQAMIAGGGLVAPILGLERFRAIQATLADDAAYEALLDHLEALALAERAKEAV
jgi:hypothetical protein